LGIAAAVVARRSLENGDALRRLLGLVAVLLVAQLTLGVAVIATGKSFWITNFHVLNGLAILALSFLGAVRTLGLGRSTDAVSYGSGGAGAPAPTAALPAESS
jgi:heme A synthase